MQAIDEQAFRELLDEAGILRPGRLPSPARSEAFSVFAQRSHATLELGALRAQASRFFGLRIGLTVDKVFREDVLATPPLTDAARVVIAPLFPSATAGNSSLSSLPVPPGTRLCFGRPATDDDWGAAEATEKAQNTTGMSALARRCATVWLITADDSSADFDRTALAIAAVFASVFLGPILTPTADGLFGVKTARRKLEAS